MIPLIPFVLGVVSGAVVVRLARSDKAKAGLSRAYEGLEKTQQSLRDVTVSGLSSLEKSSARMREKLSEPVPVEPVAAAVSKPRSRPKKVAATPAEAAQKAKPVARKRKPAEKKDEA